MCWNLFYNIILHKFYKWQIVTKLNILFSPFFQEKMLTISTLSSSHIFSVSRGGGILSKVRGGIQYITKYYIDVTFDTI